MCQIRHANLGILFHVQETASQFFARQKPLLAAAQPRPQFSLDPPPSPVSMCMLATSCIGARLVLARNAHLFVLLFVCIRRAVVSVAPAPCRVVPCGDEGHARPDAVTSSLTRQCVSVSGHVSTEEEHRQSLSTDCIPHESVSIIVRMQLSPVPHAGWLTSQHVSNPARGAVLRQSRSLANCN